MEYPVRASHGILLPLGYRGENQARSVDFSETLAKWHEQYGDGTAALLVRRCGDAAPYPAVLDGSIWTIGEADTAIPGYGQCELVYSVDNVRVASEVWATAVWQSLLGGSADPPEPQESWVEQVLEAANRAEDAADRAAEAVLHEPVIIDGTWWMWSQEAGEYVDSGENASGSPLFAAFEVDPQTGELTMTTPDEYAGPAFSLAENGHLEVTINGNN